MKGTITGADVTEPILEPRVVGGSNSTVVTPRTSPAKHPSNPMAMQVTGNLALDDDHRHNTTSASDNQMAPLSLDQDDNSKQSRKMKCWKESPFAVGLTEATWSDELRQGSNVLTACCRAEIDPESNGCLCCSGMLCSLIGAGRVGNIAIIRQSTEWVEEVVEDDHDDDDDDEDNDDGEDTNEKEYHDQDDAETGRPRKRRTTKTTIRRYTRPKLDLVVGPYWPMLCCVTYPLILGVSLWTLVGAILVPGQLPFLVKVLWTICTVGLIVSLGLTAFRDPGILYRHDRPPPQEENQWRWSDLALTYRPRGAVYDPDTAVIVEEFDHT